MKLLSAACLTFVLLLFLALAIDLAVQGGGALSAGYLTDGVRDAGRAGGVAPVLVSTLAVLALSLALATPLSLCGALLCSEILRKHPRLSALARRSFDALVSVPSIAVGLVGWALLSRAFGFSFSLFSGGLTLAVMLVPVMTVAFLNGLDGVSPGLRSEGLAVGLTRWQTVWQLLLPSARPALLAGLVLAVGRATAETAVLILTSGISARMPQSLLDPGATLAVHVYHMARNVPGGSAAAYRAALLLLMINLVLHAALTTLRRERVQ